ncbi:SDR family oxidoreductase [Mycolicibacterium sp. S3B2]|uniref:SDR family oxidoreductase n=1 Tax=Mycolicibacterium sp. S3B2 TaxID=3415120 RepID=UPI003C7D1F7D
MTTTAPLEASGPDPIRGKVTAITGASSGIGEATATLLGTRGARLVLGARRTDRLATLAEELRSRGAEVVTVGMDVRVAEDVTRLVETAVETFGTLDVLVGNAGISSLGPLADGPVTEWDAMIDVNLRGVLHGIAAAAPVFRQQGHGHFVTTVSTAGLKIVPDMGVYAATKNAVRTVMEALRQESTDGAIRVTSISPGFVRTELASGITDSARREQIRSTMDSYGLAPEAVARAVAFVIEQPHDVEIGELTIRPTVQG